MSDEATAPLSRAIGGTYLGCASPAAQSHKAAAAQRVLIQLCASGPGQERCEGTTDPVHTGGGAGNLQSSQDPASKSQAQSERHKFG